MLRAIGVIVLLAAILLGVAYYLQWYHVSMTDAKGNTSFSITFDKEKIQKAREKVME